MLQTIRAALVLVVLLLFALLIWAVIRLERIWRHDRKLLENPALRPPLAEELTTLRISLDIARGQLRVLESFDGVNGPNPELELEIGRTHERIARLEERIALIELWFGKSTGV